jgi:hypothetical protein
LLGSTAREIADVTTATYFLTSFLSQGGAQQLSYEKRRKEKWARVIPAGGGIGGKIRDKSLLWAETKHITNLHTNC